jgi:glucuronokinase
MIIESHAYARAGLVGNPSDGYFGKTLSFIIRNFAATVKLWEAPYFEIMLGPADYAKYTSVDDFLREQKLFGYYGGVRLIKAAVKKFAEHCRKTGINIDTGRSFCISYQSDIPRLVGLSGSSSIITATMRALMQFYDVQIPKHYLPTLVLACERDELGITAGLQDRVIQTYEGIVYMDFNREKVEKEGFGNYEELKPNPMPPLYVAFDPNRAEISDVPHRNLKQLWLQGDSTVIAAMKELAELTERGRAALLKGDWNELGQVVNANYGVRQKIMNIAPENHRMVEVARAAGASAHFSGSGGAITGLYKDGDQYQKLVDAMAEIGCTVIRPVIFP